MKYKAAIFDLDNTLINEDDYINLICVNFLRLKGVKNPPNLTPNILLSHDVLGDYLDSLGFDDKHLKEELFLFYCSANVPLKLKDDAREILEFLKEINIKFCLLTNGALQAQRNKIKNLNYKFLDGQVLYARSEGKDKEKPHKSAYLRALNYLNLEAKEVIFIGDNPITDIKGANNAGIFSVLLRTNRIIEQTNDATLNPDITIDNLVEIKRFFTHDNFN